MRHAVTGRNRGTIGICLIGGHGSRERDRFDDHFTPSQEKTLRKLIAEIGSRTAIDLITGHNQYAAKVCPGFHVPSGLANAERTWPMDAFITALTPHLLELLAAILTLIIGWLAAQARARWGVEIEARHREALHSALMTGGQARTRARCSRPGCGGRGRGELRSDKRA